jgi:YVTN family beta-propeller protein
MLTTTGCTLTLARQIEMPHGSEGLSLSPDNTRLYVMSQRPHLIQVIDTANDTLTDSVPLPGLAPTPEGKNPQKRIRVTPDGAYVVISSFATGQVVIAPAGRWPRFWALG